MLEMRNEGGVGVECEMSFWMTEICGVRNNALPQINGEGNDGRKSFFFFWKMCESILVMWI